MFAGEKLIHEERNPENHQVIKQIFSKVVKGSKYIKEEIYEYY